MPEGGCEPIGRDLWREGPCSLLEQPVLERLHLMEGLSMLQQLTEICSSQGGFSLEKLLLNCLPWEGHNSAAGE